MVDQNANKKVFGFGNPKNDAISMFREFCDHIPISYPNALCLGNFFQSYLNVGFRVDYLECSKHKPNYSHLRVRIVYCVRV